MATAPMVDEGPVPVPTGELAPIDDPLNPLRLAARVADPYVDLLAPGDTILATRGEAGNLKIYRELLRDDAVQSAWSQRRLALTSCETVVEPGADDPASQAAAEALREELDALNWDDVTDKALFAVFFGWGVAEIMWRPNGNRVSFDRIVVRDRARFRFDRQRSLYLYAPLNGGFLAMPERKFWIVRNGADHDDELYGLGLAHHLYWPVYFKRNDTKFWLIFLEKFGQPTALAKLPPGKAASADDRRAALAMLRKIATDAGVVVPDNVEVELLEAARSGAADYQALHDAMNRAIYKIVLGQSATSEGSPGKLGNDKTQADVKQSIVEADADLLCGSFNAGPVKWWCEWNFPGAVPPRVFRKTEPEEDLNSRAERDGKIKALGFSPTEKYVLETYGEGWEKNQAPAIGPIGIDGRPMPQPGQPGAEFAEAEFAALQALKAARRADQQALADAAAAFAENYESILAKQVGALLEAAEFNEDPDTFRRRLDELLEQGPTIEQLQPVQRASLFARMMGALRAQRRAE
jgi:phage gp29-like protein